ncbi:acetyl-CoA carboxylase biotin carboxyl carrier protein subunit [Chryseotalea sanaruensis]|uniref:Acetyl-CoA carboxylase biotin carboxyl carrier protein subunit n=1 Tax=Chryseotalea sanaruensis TaxID=2482724 RepID=A0A401UC31_9BACT|nr:acetyl-CoA carboxylase biotin carboxyl carrier protein subunit [Chryseotalea sanaruensis]GCC52439.1 acetyl-CoA carboxylase biotin carboxyl carrier protein subunit [Chryseotalea sanaruensis]
MQKATVNKKDFIIEQNDDKLFINGSALSWDVVNLNNGHFHILHDGKSYQAEIIKTDAVTKNVTLKINNNKYTVDVKDKFDLLLEKMGISSAATNKVNNVKAPMPGLIINLKVAEGDTVKAGDQLLILEAMKMENILKSPGDGVVKKIKVKKGDSVEKNQVLIEF